MKKIYLALCIIILGMTLGACMEQNTFSGTATIEFRLSNSSLYHSEQVESGNLIQEPELPSYQDYTFKGWYKDQMFRHLWNFETDLVSNHTTLYAKFVTEITHTVSKQNGVNNLNEPTYQSVVETIEVCVEPKVVVSFALEVAEIFNTLGLSKTGITHFGLPKSNLPEMVSVYNESKYTNVGTLFVPNYDALDLMMPDMIFIGGRSSNLYETLKQRYPNTDIVDVSNSNFSFDKQTKVFENLGKIFYSLKSELNTYIDEFNFSVTAIKQKSTGKDALFLLVNDDNLSVFGSGSRYGVIYNEFGFNPSDPGAQTLESHGNIVSFEYVSAVNPSIIFLLDRSQALGSSGAIDLIMNNQLIKNTKAGQVNAIYILNADSWYILPGGIESTLQMIEDIEQVFS